MEYKTTKKISIKRLSSAPLKDICINASESSIPKENFENSPKSSFQSRKVILLAKESVSTPSAPKHNIHVYSQTPKATSSKIKSPSNYVFATHNHGNKFAMTPIKQKTHKDIQSSYPKVHTNENLRNIITTAPQIQGIKKEKEHLFNTFQAIKLARALREPTIEELASKQIRLPKKKGYEKKKTVIFDLDETLIHCLNSNDKGHVEIEIEFPPGSTQKISVNIRPYAQELLSAASKDFEVIIFTASHKCYADRVIDFLDPKNQ